MNQLKLELRAERRGFFFTISTENKEITNWFASWNDDMDADKVSRINFPKGVQYWADNEIQNLWDEKGIMIQPEDVFYALTGKAL